MIAALIISNTHDSTTGNNGINCYTAQPNAHITTALTPPVCALDGSAWRLVADAAQHVPIAAIVNPNSGPGAAKDDEYVAGIEMLKSAGVEVHPAYIIYNIINSESTCTMCIPERRQFTIIFVQI